MQRSTRTLALALGVVAGGVVLWFTLRDAGAGRGDRMNGPRASGSAEVERTGASPPTLPEVRAVDEPGATSPARPVSVRLAEAGARRAAPSAEVQRAKIQVRVVDGSDGPPVSGAQVFARYVTSEPTSITNGEVCQEDVDRVDGKSLDEIVAGQAAQRTDAKGLVSVPAPVGGSTVIVARHGDRWGRLVLDEREEDEETDDEPEQLELMPDRTLVVRTVDPFGEPVGGVPVQLQRKRHGYRWSEHELRTDESNGEARFEHVQLRFADGDPEAGWGVAAMVVAPDSPRRDLDPEHLPTEPIVFEIALGGAVVVDVFGPDGAPWAKGGTVSVGVIEDGQSRRSSAFTLVDRRTVERELEGARARFEHVAPGSELDVAFSRGGSFSTHVFTDGPDRAGDEVHVSLTMGADHPVLRLRLLDPDEEPLSEVDVRVHIDNDESPFGGAGNARAQTDEAGILFVELDPGWVSGRIHVLEGNVSGVVELDRELPNGLTDLGDLILAPTPLIVSGRVVGPAGGGLAGAEIALSRFEEEDWRRLWNHEAETDDDGSFEMLGALTDERYRIQVSRDGYFGPPVEFEPGTSGLVVELGVAGAIVGAVLVDDHVPIDEFDIRLTPKGEKPPELSWQQRQTDLEEDGTFRCSPLPAGEYDVALKLGWSRTMHSVEGVVVEAGYDTRNPDLAAIDLRGALHLFKMTLVGRDAGSRTSGQVRLGEAGTDELSDSHWFHEDEIVLISRHPVIDIELVMPGFRSVFLSGISGDQRVELERGFAVRIVLVGDGEPPESPYALSLGFVPAEGDGHSIDWAAPRFDERREIVLHATTPGPVRVKWIVEQSIANSASATSADAEPEQVFHLTGGPQEQRVEVRLTKEEVERLVAMLKR